MLEVRSKPLPLPPGEVPPEGRGRGMCRQFVQECSFVWGIGAVRERNWCGGAVGSFVGDRCSEPSQALRASSPGGRAKGLVGVGGRSVKFRFVVMFDVCTN